jgi:hypothetical protein
MRDLIVGSLIAVVCVVFAGSSVAAQKLKAEEIVAKHVESLGSPEARAAVKNRIAVGRVLVKFISQKNQTEGRVVLASAPARNFLGMTLSAGDYSSEKFVFDGKKSHVGYAHNGRRSVLGSFIESNSWIIEESLLAGTLANSWTLASAGKGKISSDGLKQIDGREVYVLGYSRKGGGDVDIKLYFDKNTFRHVRTEYKRISSAGIGRTPEESSGLFETRYKVVEDFSDFKEETGLMLPHSYKLLYSVTGQNGTTEIEWNFDLTEFAFYQDLDANTFSAGT